MNHPLHIGITGGIGTGKSLVSRIFRCLGVPVYDADKRAKELMTSDPILVQEIKKAFGEKTYYPDGTLDRVFLANATFGNPGPLSTLNQLVHPRVANDYKSWVTQWSASTYVLREAALLYESGAYTTVDKMIVVTAPLELRMERILQRDTHRTRHAVEAIMASQLAEEEKISRADFVIQNDETRMVIPQVLALHQKLLVAVN